MLAVAGGRRLLSQFGQFLRNLELPDFNLTVVSKGLGRWINDHLAGKPIEQGHASAFELLSHVVQSHDRRNAEGARHNRGMGGAASEVRCDAEDAMPVHRRRVRGCEIVGDKNVRFTWKRHRFWRLSLQIANDAAHDILNVQGAFAQIRIVDFAQCLCVAAGDFLEDRFDLDQIGLKLAQDFVDQRSIFDHEQMGIENPRVFCPNGFRNPLLHLENLHSRLHESGFETRNFGANLRGVDFIADDFLKFVAHDLHNAASNSGRDPNTSEPRFAFFPVATHSQQSSPVVNLR